MHIPTPEDCHLPDLISRCDLLEKALIMNRNLKFVTPVNSASHRETHLATVPWLAAGCYPATGLSCF
jgi:hypothetical protein